MSCFDTHVNTKGASPFNVNVAYTHANGQTVSGHGALAMTTLFKRGAKGLGSPLNPLQSDTTQSETRSRNAPCFPLFEMSPRGLSGRRMLPKTTPRQHELSAL